ncbi:MAG: hypothetical protein JW800_01005 [Candidatus Omnitrophica bacterium]|nr:hypothetical protein [Candidatus Omnitrophota bacterium]
MGLVGVMHSVLLLTVVFFVLYFSKKLEESPLKSFGRILVVLLSAGAILIFCVSLISISTGNCRIVNMLGWFSAGYSKCQKMSYMKRPCPMNPSKSMKGMYKGGHGMGMQE